MLTLSPALYTVEDDPTDGLGDRLLPQPPVAAYIVNAPSDRVLAGFHLYQLPAALTAPSQLAAAQLRGRIVVNNSLDTGVRNIQVRLFGSDGTPRATDFQAVAALVGSVSYYPPAQNEISFSIDVRAQLRALLSANASHLGVRLEPTNRQAASAAPIQSGAATLTLTIVPEPSASCAILFPAAALVRTTLRQRRNFL
jgi:hypothetical protein